MSIGRFVWQRVFAMTILMSFGLVSFAAAAIGDSRENVEKRYGEVYFIQDAQSRVWSKDNWQQVPRNTVKAFGYRTAAGGRQAIVWVEYNRQNKVAKETTILDSQLKIRDFKNYFPDLYTAVAARDSEIVVIKSVPKDQLGVIVRAPAKKLNLIRFYTDDLNDATKINMHSGIRGFEITEITAGEVKKRLAGQQGNQYLASTDEKQVFPTGTWLKTDNYFRPELYFSEKLVARITTDMIVIHHTAKDDMSVADIHDLHLTKGWAGIAYHKVILADGTVENGRPEPMIGAHALGANPRSIGIVVDGDFHSKPPTNAQMDTLVTLTRSYMLKYNIPVENVVPHREVTPGTECPGEKFPWQEFIDRLRADSPSKTDTPAPSVKQP